MGLNERWVRKCVEWSRREASKRRQVLTLALGTAVFLLILPALLITAGRGLDHILGIADLLEGWAWRAVGAVAGALGWLFAAWSLYVQLVQGRGTPVPIEPPRRLITTGPYARCRNPLALGTLVFYVGLAVAFGSPSAALLALGLLSPVLALIKLIEERELEARFGEDYRGYRERTPFLLPRVRPKRGGSD